MNASARRTPAWLADFQARFGEVLRMPLARSQNRLRAELERYPSATLADLSANVHGSASERLAVYHRQVWFRLFSVLQSEYPLTARLFGMWTFNGYASEFLAQNPPQHYDIANAADGFAEYLAEKLVQSSLRLVHGRSIPTSAIVEAARIDDAYRAVFSAPQHKPLAITPAHAARLPEAQLVPGAHFRLLQESWPLVELRRSLRGDAGEDAVVLPQAHKAPQWWLMVNTEAALNSRPLAALEGRLLSALCREPVALALATLEQQCTAQERELLLKHAQAWLQRSVQDGLWVDARLEPGSAP